LRVVLIQKLANFVESESEEIAALDYRRRVTVEEVVSHVEIDAHAGLRERRPIR
jgi:hypothetical protein